MRRAIVGSRGYPDLAAVRAYMLALPADTVIVTGGARGVDKAAELAGRARGLEVVVLKAKWDEHGKSAGMLRNMIVVSECEAMTAFWDGHSPGTRDVIRRAQRAGLPVEVIFPATPSPPASP